MAASIQAYCKHCWRSTYIEWAGAQNIRMCRINNEHCVSI